MRYLWDRYFEITDRVRRVREHVCEPIPPSEMLAWLTLKRLIVSPAEYDILAAIDDAYCDEMNKELKQYLIRQSDSSKKPQPDG